MTIERDNYLQKMGQLLQEFPVVALLGPRQCGKTTLANAYHEKLTNIPTHYFDLEDPLDTSLLDEPKSTLENLSGLIVIDEIQLQPDLFPLLRVLADRYDDKQWLILGSASRHLIQHSSETLAGRLAYIDVTPFSFDDVNDLETLWIRGGFPRSYLADSIEASTRWRKFYIRSFLEQDIPSLGFKILPQNMRRFWMMLSHYHGQTLNVSELATSLRLSQSTVKHYTDLLTDTFMIRQLQPWIENIKKRQVKTPKIYFRDSGILHTLLAIHDKSALYHHPKLGASWEGFALESIIRHLEVEAEDCYFWGIHNQAELDLLIIKEGRRLGFEIKFCDAPTITNSMRTAQELLQLDSLIIIYPGEKRYELRAGIQAIGLREFLTQHML